MNYKMTEDEVIEHYCRYLIRNKWSIKSCCKEGKRGIDIVASRGNEVLLVEAKGAKSRDEAPTKKRKQFDCGQVKTILALH
jgi:hypothetical protein